MKSKPTDLANSKTTQIPVWLMPVSMRYANGKAVSLDEIEQVLEQKAEKLLDEALSKKHMLKYLYDGLADDKGLVAGTQQQYREALVIGITDALRVALVEKLHTRGKGIAILTGSYVVIFALIGASVVLGLSSLERSAVVGIGLLLAICYLACCAIFGAGLDKTMKGSSWYKKLNSDTPGEAMDEKALQKVAGAISEATQVFEIPKSHSDRYQITKSYIQREMNGWKCWSPTMKHADFWNRNIGEMPRQPWNLLTGELPPGSEFAGML